MKMLAIRTLVSAAALASLIAAPAAAQTPGRSGPDGRYDWQLDQQVGRNSDVFVRGKKVGRDPDPFIRSQIQRGYELQGSTD
jgi:hypothetical protein